MNNLKRVSVSVLGFAAAAVVFLTVPASASAAIVRVQSKSVVVTNGTTATITLPQATAPGDTLLVKISEYTEGSFTFTLSDNASNAWIKDMSTSYAVGKTENDVWRASNIAGSASSHVTVTASGATYFIATAVEYSGIATSSPLDGTATWQYYMNNGGNGSTTYHSGFVTTSQANDLLLGGAMNDDYNGNLTATPATGWTLFASSQNQYMSDVLQDKTATTVGSYEASGVWSASSDYPSGFIVAYKAATGGGGGGNGNPPVISNIQASNVASSSATIAWTTDITSDSQVNYGTTTAYGQSSALNSSLVTSHSVNLSGLSSATLYHYQVRSASGSNVTLSTDNVFTTGSGGGGDSTPPSIPTNLSATAISSSQINLSWVASTDNTGVAGYKVYRGGVQIATSTTNTYNDTGLAASTNYSYTVAAYDAAGNVSAQSVSASATTQGNLASGGMWTDLINTALRASATNYACPPNGFQPPSGGMPSYAFAGSCPGIINDWSGAAADTSRNRLLFYGGGHASYSGNEVYALDLSTRSPSTGTSCSSANCSTNAFAPTLTRLNDPSVFDPNFPTNINADGTPVAEHTFGSLVYLPQADKMFGPWFGGGPNTVDANLWLLNLKTMTWANSNYILASGSYAPGSGEYMSCALDPTYVHESVLCWGGNTDLFRYDVVTNTVTELTRYGNVVGPAGCTPFCTSLQDGAGNGIPYPSAVVDPDNHTLITFGSYEVGMPGVAFSTDITGATPVTTNITAQTTGCQDLMGYADPGLQWDSARHTVVGYVPRTEATSTSNNEIIEYNPTTKVCTTVQSGGGPVADDHFLSLSRGMWGRFSYFPALDKFVVVNNAAGDAWTFQFGTSTSTDTTAPTVPTNLSGTAVSSTIINLSWTASTDNVGVTGYKIYRGGAQVGTATSPSYSDTGLTASTTYSYTVSAYDAAGNNSAQSASVNATTLPPSIGADITPPMITLQAKDSGNNLIVASSTVDGLVTISVNAIDPVVANQVTSGINSVSLMLDGSVVATSSTGVVNYSFNTRTLTNTSHSITATAQDNAGNSANSITFLLGEIGFFAGWH